MRYVEYIGALISDVPELTEKGKKFLLTRLQNEGIVSFARGFKDAYDAVLTSLAEDGSIPLRIPYLCRNSVVWIDPDSPARILDLLGCFNKLSIPGLECEDPWDKYKSRLSEVASFSGFDFRRIVDDRTYHVVRSFLAYGLGTAPKCVIGRHGPGATYEKLSGWDKWLAMDTLPLPSFIQNRIVSVPKDISGKRVIAIEGVKSQFIQQGISRCLRQTRYFRSYFNLQDLKRHIALSSRQDYVTVDLKDASDRLGLPFLSLLPDDWGFLFRRYSSSMGYLPSGEMVDFPFIASMGNGFCFELETLLFHVIAVASNAPSNVGEAKNYANFISVYGDDIVMPDWMLPRFEYMMARLSLRLNHKKTCRTASFKETVGMWICDGVARERFLPRLTGTLDGILLSGRELFGFADRAARSGYWTLVSLLLEGRQFRTRWNKRFHRYDIQLEYFHPLKRPLNVVEDTRWKSYWMEGRYNETEEDTFDGVLKKGWIPMESFPSLFSFELREGKVQFVCNYSSR